jgi:hypothetical protein
MLSTLTLNIQPRESEEKKVENTFQIVSFNILILHSFSSGSRHAKAFISNGLEDLHTSPSNLLDCNSRLDDGLATPN